MAKVTALLLVQSIFTFILGLILASQGVPASPEDASLQVGEALVDQVADTFKDDERVVDVANNGKASLKLVGIWMSIVSAIQFTGLIIALCIS